MEDLELSEWIGPDEAMTELARRNAILDAIGYAATQIVAGSDWRAGIQELLDRLGQATGVSRVTLFDVHEGPDGRLAESCRYDWAEEGLPKLSSDPRYQNMPLVDEQGMLDAWTQQRQRGEVVLARLRDLAGYNRQVFLEHGTLSFVSVPIMLRSGYWGFLGFDDCRIERAWSGLEIDVLKAAGALIAGALERAEADERLRLSEERYALAARGANDGLWDWDVATDRAYFSPRLHEILGLVEGALGQSMTALFDQFHDEDAQAVRGYIGARFRHQKRKFRFEARQRTASARPRWFVARGMVVYGAGRPARVVGSLRDITDHKLAEAQLAETERQRASLARYFSPNMVDEMMRAGGRLEAARSLQATVLFADLFNFTAMSSNMPGEQIIGLLREFHALVEDAVFAFDGTLDKYIGDGLMATFGTPRPSTQDATNAVRCARQMVTGLNGWNRRREAEGLPRLQIGVGLHHGEVTLGDVGSARRLEFTVVGNTVNLASRIESISRVLDTAIIASEAAIEAVRREGGGGVLEGFRDLGMHAIRGRRERIELWGLTAVSLDDAE